LNYLVELDYLILTDEGTFTLVDLLLQLLKIKLILLNNSFGLLMLNFLGSDHLVGNNTLVSQLANFI